MALRSYTYDSKIFWNNLSSRAWQTRPDPGTSGLYRPVRRSPSSCHSPIGKLAVIRHPLLIDALGDRVRSARTNEGAGVSLDYMIFGMKRRPV